MALPVTISGVQVGTLRNSYNGPFKSSGGAFYAVLKTLTGGAIAEVHKATNPTSSFAEADSGNSPSFAASISSLNAFQDGDILHAAGQNASDDVYFAQFNMADDTWADPAGDSSQRVLIDGAPNGTTQACDIAVLSASYGAGSAFVKIRVVYQGATDMDMGNDFERIDESNSVDDGVNWSAPTQIDNGVSVPGLHYTGPRIVLPPSNADQCHILFKDSGESLVQRAIAGDDTLRTYRDTTFNTANFTYPLAHPIGFVRSSVSKVRLLIIRGPSNDPEVLEFDSFDDDTDRTEDITSISTDNVLANNGSIVACLSADGSVIRGLMVKASDDDLYEFFDDDADSYTLQGTRHGAAGTYNHISCNVYDRSGTKLAMIYDDGGTVKYDEIDFAVGVTLPIFDHHYRAMRAR